MSTAHEVGFRIAFPERLCIDHNGDHFVKEVVPQFHRLLKEAGYNLEYDMNVDKFLESVKTPVFSGKVIFDLSNTIYFGLPETLKIQVIGDFCRRLTGDKVVVIFPENEDRRRFLELMDVYGCFCEWAELKRTSGETEKWELGSSLSNSLSVRILPITPIKRREDVGHASSELIKPKVTKILENDFGMNEEAIQVLADTLAGEISGNICEHSKSEGFIAAQVHKWNPNIRTNPEYVPNVELAISDGGIGIHQSLMNKEPKKYSEKTGTKAIEMVLNGDIPKISGEEKFHGGINRVRDRIKEDFSGEIYIESAFSVVRRWYKSGYSRQYDREALSNFFIGTHIDIKLPRRSRQFGES